MKPILCFIPSIALFLSFNTNGQLKPGDIHPNAKYLDIDQMRPFNGGAAVVIKGNASALIDTDGGFIVPFGEYQFNMYTDQNGIFTASTANGGIVVINSKGKLIEAPGYEYYLFSKGKYAIFHKGYSEYIYIDKENNKYKVTTTDGSPLRIFSEGIGTTLLTVQTAKKIESFYAYKNLQNIFINRKKYGRDGAEGGEPFSDGLACVGQTDGFGEMKYGFINIKGEEVIPPKYSIKPTNFRHGLAKITPQDKSEFMYAYINKQGEIVIKHTLQDKQKYGEFKEFVEGGYAYSPGHMMDTTGKITNQKEFLNNLDISVSSQRQRVWILESDKNGTKDGKIRFEKTFDGSDYNTKGFIDLKSKKVISFAFASPSYGGSALDFDPVSKLAYAERYLGRDNQGNAIYRKGYINEDGIFMIVMGPKSKW